MSFNGTDIISRDISSGNHIHNIIIIINVTVL